jgi:glycine dehydrogenase subunit 1
MTFKYFPHTQFDIDSMLKVINKSSLIDLFSDIPTSIRYKGNYQLEEPLSESQLCHYFKNVDVKHLKSFTGFGAYEHERPSIIDALSSRQEFLTSYTPYQPEVSQGTLQYIFEFQSLMCELTGMDVSNASMYDGSTATAEAMMMIVAHTNRQIILIDEGLFPHVIQVLKTYARYRDVKLISVSNINGIINRDEIKNINLDEVAGIILAYPNKFGIIDSFEDISSLVHEAGGQVIAYANPTMLAVIKSPADLNADIVCGEAQSLGLPVSFGGPYLGYLTAKQHLLRKMPGRICGMTNDVNDKRGYVLTLQAREQHIRRDKANSNICSNQSLLALQATIYLATLGKTGLVEVATNAMKACRYLVDKLIKTKLFFLTYDQPYGFEVCLSYVKDAYQLHKRLLNVGYLAGQPLNEHELVFYTSEMKSKQDIDDFVMAIEEISDER